MKLQKNDNIITLITFSSPLYIIIGLSLLVYWCCFTIIFFLETFQNMLTHHCSEFELSVELDERDVEGARVRIVIFGIALLAILHLKFDSLRMLVKLLSFCLEDLFHINVFSLIFCKLSRKLQ
jgi:hypothetical protein